MKLKIGVLVCTTVFLARVAISRAACQLDDRIPNGGIYIYQGNVGTSAVRVALAMGKNEFEGRYVYRISTTDIILKGKLGQSGETLALTEFDAAGRASAAFAGTFLDSDPSFANGSKLECEIVAGKWNSGGRVLDFRLELDAIVFASLNHLYAGLDNDEVVNHSATAFRSAIAKNDRKTVASLIKYPIYADVSGKRTKIASASTLILNYDAVFTAPFRATIEGAFTRLMFSRGEGVMISDGAVWFDGKGKVIALNN